MGYCCNILYELCFKSSRQSRLVSWFWDRFDPALTQLWTRSDHFRGNWFCLCSNMIHFIQFGLFRHCLKRLYLSVRANLQQTTRKSECLREIWEEIGANTWSSVCLEQYLTYIDIQYVPIRWVVAHHIQSIIHFHLATGNKNRQLLLMFRLM